jgi:hypothetical protein
MTRSIDFATVRRIALELPGVEQGTMYGSPALKFRGKLLACVPTNRAAEPNSLVVCVDFADRNALLAEAPDLYYLPEHYVNYPSVLVRLGRLTPEVLRDLLAMSYRFVSRKAVPRSQRSAEPEALPRSKRVGADKKPKTYRREHW